MKQKLAVTLVPLIIVFGIFAIFSTDKYPNVEVNIPMAEKHRGVCWVGGRNIIEEKDLAEIAGKNVNWISQTPFGWQRGHDNPQIGNNRSSDYTWWGERDEGLIKTTQYAKQHGIKTILKPHIWLRDEGGKWRGEIKMKSEEDWLKWFENYTGFIMHYAKLAEEQQMEMLCIGTELHQTCVDRADDWRKLIAKIRTVYSGPLTYAANFGDEYQDVPFWDELDYIGVQAYFPLTKKENPSVRNLRDGWKQPIKDLKKLSAKYGKPILFTEVGYKSTKDSGIEPWTWPQRIDREEREAIYSEKTQAALYEALFAEVMDEPWLAGVHLWKWYPNYEQRLNSRRGSKPYYSIDFTPQAKEAEKVMTKWFGKFAK
jgi:hypothetical protein